MTLRKAAASAAAMVFMGVAAASTASAQAWGNYSWNQKTTNLSVFAAVDTKSDKSGLGVSLAMQDQGITEISYLHFDDNSIVQASKMTSKQLGGYPVLMGVSAAYSSPKVGSTTPKGLMTGLEVVMNVGKSAKGLSIDLRASSLSKGVNPIKWITDADVLWAGAGMSYTF